VLNSEEKQELFDNTEFNGTEDEGIINCDNETHGLFSSDGFKQ
jgi:hypothetical protein